MISTPGLACGIGLGGVFHCREERHRELGDEAELHVLAPRPGPAVAAKASPASMRFQSHRFPPFVGAPLARSLVAAARARAAYSVRPRRRRSSRRGPACCSPVGFSSPTLRPWRSTTARSASSTTCSMLWVIRITALPSARSCAIRSSTLRALAQAQRGRRFVEDHHVAGKDRGAGDGDRLALAARHQRDRRVEVRQHHLEPVDHRGRLAVHRRAS